MIRGNNEVSKELNDEFGMIGIGEDNDRKEGGEDKKINDVISELDLVD